MPTLIRLFVVLLVLAGLAFAGMIALIATVDPGVDEVRVRVPPRDLVPPAGDASQTLRGNLPALQDEVAAPVEEPAPAPQSGNPADNLPPE